MQRPGCRNTDQGGTAMLTEIGQKAKETSYVLGKMGTNLKNAGLLAAAQEILDGENEILKANAADVARAKERGMAPGLVDRLELNHKRIEGIVEGMRQVVGLDDPVGEVISMKKRPNGLLIGQKRVPLGVIGIIYEARPNVTADAFALCFKAGNAVSDKLFTIKFETERGSSFTLWSTCLE